MEVTVDGRGCTDWMVLFSTGESLVCNSLASFMRFPRGVPEALWGLFGFFPPQTDPLSSQDKVSLQLWVMVQPGPESAPLGDHEAVVSLGLASVRGQGCDGFRIWKVRLQPLQPTCGPGKPCILRFFGHWACQQALVVRVELGSCFHQPLLTRGKRQGRPALICGAVQWSQPRKGLSQAEIGLVFLGLLSLPLAFWLALFPVILLPCHGAPYGHGPTCLWIHIRQRPETMPCFHLICQPGQRGGC